MNSVCDWTDKQDCERRRPRRSTARPQEQPGQVFT